MVIKTALIPMIDNILIMDQRLINQPVQTWEFSRFGVVFFLWY
jgi:hypothetical protein